MGRDHFREVAKMMSETATVGGTMRGVVETIHSPLYPGDVLTLTQDIEETQIFRPLNLHPDRADWSPVVVDDSPAALIARLTAGDRREDGYAGGG